MYQLISQISTWAIPVLIALILSHGIYKKVSIYETFVEGAKEGFGTSVNMIPHLVGMMVAIQVFRESGALEVLIRGLEPMLSPFQIPSEIIPLAIIRPITGSGSLAVMTDIIATYGPDSFLGRLASTMQGSTDTTLYVFTVYFGAVGIRKGLYAIKVGLLADLAGMIASIIIVSLVF
ncbi:spore maturation protein [Microaerobacter geothermalis]|uniref:spore maturation protein n=1 Tax=Microaerobacter geothermalis TaxID=674972 RepID=UPI001F46BFA2|nr:spore maturation protein [Microaerobacter geothermalis]MCF6093489.1 spore maturation protein [Microaerobacter geothermalis]